MAKDVSEAVQRFVSERGIAEELAQKIISDALMAAYKKRFGGAENAIVRFTEDGHLVSIFARKKVVDGVYDPAVEIELEEAEKLTEGAELGDELLIELDPESFSRIAIQNARQVTRQSSREMRNNSLFDKYKSQEGAIIIGYYQRERNGTVYVDLGSGSLRRDSAGLMQGERMFGEDGRDLNTSSNIIEGVLPKKYQSPREVYHIGDRIKALIYKVEKTPTGLQIVLSRTHTEFVTAIFEAQVPEVGDHTVEIHKIVREPGYRTKLAVYTNRPDVDPVGAIVGKQGMRIQPVISELEGEKIDVIKYDSNPELFIKNALSPAEVRRVFILDHTQHKALAVVAESQLSLAIGKQGLNVKLANRLCDWSIDVKTDAQAREMDIVSTARQAAEALFDGGEYEEYSKIADIPGVDQETAAFLAEHGIEDLAGFVEMSDAQVIADTGVDTEKLAALRKVIEENVEFIEENEAEKQKSSPFAESGEAEAAAEEEEYQCPECGAKITLDMTECPNCGVELSFEYEAD